MTPEEQSLFVQICSAIQSKNLVRFWYENSGHGRKEFRIVEPHLIGSFAQRHVQLSAWLVPTPEQVMSGQKEGWRSYVLRNIQELQTLDETFQVRPDFDPKGSGMKEIFCQPMKIAK